jgi:hypothetical protein
MWKSLGQIVAFPGLVVFWLLVRWWLCGVERRIRFIEWRLTRINIREDRLIDRRWRLVQRAKWLRNSLR